MPLVRISLTEGRPAEEIRAIADGVHAALVDSFDVPLEDRFQVIEECKPNAIIFSASYMGVERTDALVIIHIVASVGRDVAQKQALYRAIADRLAAAPGMRPEDVQIILSPHERSDWSFGNGVASYVSTEPRS